MVERHPSRVETAVRFPPSAPHARQDELMNSAPAELTRFYGEDHPFFFRCDHAPSEQKTS